MKFKQKKLKTTLFIVTIHLLSKFGPVKFIYFKKA